VRMSFERVQTLTLCSTAGITYSNDKVLQSRINAYQDTQRYRIGNKCELALHIWRLHVWQPCCHTMSCMQYALL
jgi:catalase